MPTDRNTRTKPPRARSTRDEMDTLRRGLLDIVVQSYPMTVRQTFYAASVVGLVDKTEEAYRRVQRALLGLRESGDLDWEWIADGTRWVRKAASYSSPLQMVKDTAALYRKALWRDQPVRVEVWLEKDALAGVIYEVTDEFDVPLMVSRGLPARATCTRPRNSLRPSASRRSSTSSSTTTRAAPASPRTSSAAPRVRPGREDHVQGPGRDAAADQAWRLPTRPTKTTDSRAVTFGSDVSVELDAIPADWLRDLVRKAIEKHMPARELAVLKDAEESERDSLLAWPPSSLEKLRATREATRTRRNATGGDSFR